MPTDDSCLDNLDDALDEIAYKIRKVRNTAFEYRDQHEYISQADATEQYLLAYDIPILRSVINYCKSE